MQPYAPLGTMYAAAWLRHHGYEVRLHDVMFAEGPDSLKPVLADFRPDILVIYDDGFNYLTKMCLTNMREAAFRMSEMAKGSGCKVIVSSSDSTDHFDKYLDHNADYVIIGEAEQTLLDLVNSIQSRAGDPISITGIVTRIDGKTIRTASRAVMTDLDTLPLPAWDLVDIEQYRAGWLRSTGYFSMNIGTTRGCPFKCNWCAKPIYGNRYNARSPENVVQELKLLKENYGVDHIWFCDDIFGLKPGWVKKFSELVHSENLRFRFKIQSRADLLLKDEQIEPLANAGCEVVWMGAESGSQKILDAMDKGTTIEQISQATAGLKKHGIKPAFFLQFGYLGETADDIRKTLTMIKTLVPAEIGVSVSYPLPGTKFYEKVREQLGDKTNWTDSDELALMFENTYPREFYKRLHRYVHSFYRKIRAVDQLKKGFSHRSFSRQHLLTLMKLPFYTVSAAQHKLKFRLKFKL
ncbi:B12-binding domain-containing radical SAM protein [Polluticoccus soli]|uniref:B12-binding domain-containing radical SAM protein n=1 Tax=Polluticoccus soli TaxID=3034150 RepID=UPI0023E26D21|nr:radical SAM protein [Flavipsychrobacter sp. JY13-12]